MLPVCERSCSVGWKIFGLPGSAKVLPTPCAVALVLALALALRLVFALVLALPTNPLQHRLLTTSTTDVEKTKIRDRDAGEKLSSLPGWKRTTTGRTQAKQRTSQQRGLGSNKASLIAGKHRCSQLVWSLRRTRGAGAGVWPRSHARHCRVCKIGWGIVHDELAWLGAATCVLRSLVVRVSRGIVHDARTWHGAETCAPRGHGAAGRPCTVPSKFLTSSVFGRELAEIVAHCDRGQRASRTKGLARMQHGLGRTLGRWC
jgi:hypothetical protein